jgi:hypothetical protein
MIDLDFTWYRHTEGYRLKDSRVVPKGESIQSYRPLQDFPTLYKVFVDQCKTERGVREFIDKFGPLSVSPANLITQKVLAMPGLISTRGDLVTEVIEQAKLMNRQLKGHMIPQLPLTNLGAVLVPDTGAIKLKLSPSRLIDALWLQMAQAISGGQSVKECRQCGIPFKVGPGSGRRFDAKFCCDEHRIAFNSRARSL